MNRVLSLAVIVVFALSPVARANDDSSDAASATTQSQSSAGDSSSTGSVDEQGHGSYEPGMRGGTGSGSDTDDADAINHDDPSPG